jgi:hypothetical protein
VDHHTQKQAGSAIRINEKIGVIKEMRILLGTLLGYGLRQRERLLITILTIVLITIYIVLPTLSLAIQAIALTHLGLSVHRERLARPKQTRVPAIKGLDYQSAVTTLRDSHLNIRVLATRYDLPQQPGTIVDQSPAPGEQVDYNYAVGVTITDTTLPGRRTRGLTGNSVWGAKAERLMVLPHHLLCSIARNSNLEYESAA